MEPHDEKPDAAQSRVAEPDPGHPEINRPEPVQDKAVQTQFLETRMKERKFAHTSRRELLKLAPLLALGAFAIPPFQKSLLKRGLAFSDWVSAGLFRRGHLAPTFADAQLTPFEKFPINGYDVDDPGVVFETWTLHVSGAVQKPGEYKLAQIQALPRVQQN